MRSRPHTYCTFVSLTVALKFLTIYFQYIGGSVCFLGVKIKFDSMSFFLAVRTYKPKPGCCFMRIIDREARIDKLREGNIVNEAGYSVDPGGITTHSSLISCKAAWNPMLSDLINVLSPSLSTSASLLLLCSLSHSVFWA